MNKFFYSELRRCCSEIKSLSEDKAKTAKVADAYERAISLADTARKEGLLALEEAVEKMDFSDRTLAFLRDGIMLVTDGTEPEIVDEMGMNQIAVNVPSDYDGLILLLYHKAVLLIQAGVNPRLMESYLMSMVPVFIAEEMREKSREIEERKMKEKKSRVELLCEDDGEIDEKSYYITDQAALAILALSNKEMQRVLRDVDHYELMLAMKGLPGKARKRIFDSMSQRLGGMIAEDMHFVGPVPMKNVEEACVKVIKILMKLEDSGEIYPHDFSKLQIIIDMYEIKQKENQELRKKYKELYDMLNQIYRS